MPEKNDYSKRQLNILSNLGMFYLIIIALFAIPLCAAFVVVIINGVMDLKYVILPAAGVGGAVMLIFIFRYARNMFHRIRSDGASAYRDASGTMNRGEPVQLSLMNGLVTFSYGRDTFQQALPYHGNPDHLLAPPDGEPLPGFGHPDIVTRLKDLAELKKQGAIDDEEFLTLKTRLIRESDDHGEPSDAID